MRRPQRGFQGVRLCCQENRLPEERGRPHYVPVRRTKQSRLNPEQRAAVESIDGPLLILAGAGSGKTTVITRRIVRMIESGIPAQSIVAVTFTNRAAREMKERLRKLVDRKRLRGMIVSTFHSLGNRILQKEIECLPGYRLPFSILSPEDLANVMADIYRSLKLDPSQAKEDGILFHVSLFKNSGLSAAHYVADNNCPQPDLFEEIATRYARALHDLNGVDFDDLLLLPARIFRRDPEILKRYRKRWKHFLVDEYQDTNRAQYDLLRLLVGKPGNLCVVGDDDQSIYGWRGADINIILGFAKDYPAAQTVRLEENYRSTQTILSTANAVIRNNSERMGKTLRASSGHGAPIKAILAADESREAKIIVEEIHAMILKGKRTPGDIAILFRTNFQSRVFEQELRARNIPHHVVGGYRFFDRREVRDMIAYLRVIANPKDDVALIRIVNRPRRGIGEGSIKKINDYILDQPERKRPSLMMAFEQILATPGLIAGIRSDAISALNDFYELLEKYRKLFHKARRLSPVLSQLIQELSFENEFRREGDNDAAVRARIFNLSELVNMLSYMEDNWDESEPPGLFDFLARLSMMATDQDEESPRGRVQLLTLHLSKGLEFPVVYLAGLEEGLFPAPRSLSEARVPDVALGEERRLLYVGITRAREELWLSAAASRRRFGDHVIVEPSRFWDEIPDQHLDWLIREENRPEGEGENALTDFLGGLKMMGTSAT